MNIGQYIASNVAGLKEFSEPSTKMQQGLSALQALSKVMGLLQRFVLRIMCFQLRLLTYI